MPNKPLDQVINWMHIIHRLRASPKLGISVKEIAEEFSIPEDHPDLVHAVTLVKRNEHIQSYLYQDKEGHFKQMLKFAESKLTKRTEATKEDNQEEIEDEE